MRNNWISNFVNLLVLFLLPFYIAFHALILPVEVSVAGITDSGFVSIVTLSFIASAFIVILTLVFNTHLTTSKITACAGAYSVLIYFMREADFHRLFTIEHVTRGKFYLMETVPFWQKLIAAIVFIVFAVAILFLLIKYSRLAWVSFKKFNPWSVALFFWFFVLSISQLCDRTDLNKTHLGRIIEECCECWAAIFMFLFIIQMVPQLNLRENIKRNFILNN